MVATLVLATGTGAEALAQAYGPVREARLAWIGGGIRLDGVPDEPLWGTADSITDFIQRDPAEGAPPSERTVVRLLGTRDGLYIGVWAYDREPATIRHAQLRRDADFESDDHFSVILDPQRDHRSGYVFAVNPNGALRDAEMLTFESANTDWNGVWDARARRTPSGWTAELFLPWQTLRYRRDADVWGANFQRVIRRTNEEALWRAWRRTEGLLFLEKAGLIAGFTALPPRGRVELRPYTTVTAELRDLSYAADGSDSIRALASQSGKAGIDAKVAVASTLTLDLTANTDFAQVEADRQVVNLTRFPLFFPEKRTFFLESGGIFEFGQRERTLVFHSRRIGLAPDGTPIPLTGGARLTGRSGRERIGLLVVRTGDPERALDVVARVKRDVLAQGYVGGIFASQSGPGVSGIRLTGGLDLNLPFVVRGQNLVLAAFAASSRDRAGTPARAAWRMFLDYPNDLMDNFIGYTRVERGFDPALGFVSETGIDLFQGRLQITPRPHRWGIRKLLFEPISWEHVTDVDGDLSHARYSVQPLGARLDSGDEFEFQFHRLSDVPPDTFEIFPGDTILPGRYDWTRAELELSSSNARAVSVSVGASAGEYYSGHATEVEAELTVRTARYLLTNLELSQQDVRLPSGSFVARTARLRIDLAASPRLNTTVFLQGDNESNRLTLNARLHWIPSPGSDAYLVWNSAWPTGLPNGIPWRQPQRGALVGKLVYYFRV
ncbi:MAG: carbohydrate binding family 9 domain-containing protein [Gemmatimonadetes bacterium]|nr:carbohydrate binding family 9 domain-containing protein [Gemmatimonadota bacterium]